MRKSVRIARFTTFGQLNSRRFRKLARLMLAAAPVAAAVSFYSSRAMGGVNYTGVTDTWTGTVGDGNWGTSGNWTTTNAGGIPLNGDALVFGGAQAGTITDNIGDGTFGFEQIDGITFNGVAGSNGYTVNAGTFSILNGSNTVTVTNTIFLSGQNAASAASNLGINVGITNTLATVNQTINANVALDWGYHVFGAATGSTLSLNGTLTAYSPSGANSPAPILGALAYFNANGAVEGTNLTADANGLINGLDGVGLAENSGGTLTGLATIGSAGNIIPYAFGSNPNDQVIASSGTLGLTTIAAASANAVSNVELTSQTAGVTYTFSQSNPTVNTITSTNAAKQTDLVVSGTLTLGQVGGIYITNPSGSAQEFELNGGEVTAGTTAAGGEIVFMVNGTNTSNEMEMNSNIIDNSAGGKVTVIKSGLGSMYFAGATKYSGGTYVDQGYLQLNNGAAAGTGPVYVASGATIYIQNNGGTYANAFYLSPGVGSASNGGDGEMKFSAANQTITGVLTLTGDPIVSPTTSTTVAGGDRIASATSAQNVWMTSQITGSGTLELTAGAATVNFNLQNQGTGALANNWTGGLNIDSISASDSIYIKTRGANEIASGVGTGNITFLADGANQERIDLEGNNETVNSLNTGTTGSTVQVDSNLQIGNFDSGSANSTLTIGANNTNGTFGGSVQGNSLNLVKIGTGTQVFSLSYGSTTNSYGGFTELDGGVLNVAQLTNLSTNGDLGFAGEGTPAASANLLFFNGGALQYTGSAAQSTNRLFTIGDTNAAAVGNDTATIDASGSAGALSPVTFSNTGAIAFGDSNNHTLVLTGSNTGANTFAPSLSDGSSQSALTKNGSGVWYLSGNSTYSGATTINGGTLVVNGSLNTAGTVLVNNNTTLLGAGSMGTVTNAGGTIGPGASLVTTGTMNMGGLVSNGGDLVFNVGGATASEINVSGLANLVGGTLALGFLSPPTLSSYTLVAAGSLTVGSGFDLPGPITNGRSTYTTEKSGNDIIIDVSGQAANLVWIGANNGGTWDTNTTANWNDPTYGIADDVFFPADNVTFNDTTSVNTVNIAGTVAPTSIVVNTSNTYTIQGAGMITGQGSLTKAGVGTLILATSNTYSLGTNIQNGLLQVQASGALGTGSLSLGDSSNDSGVLDLDGNSISVGSLSTIGNGAGNIIGNSSTTTVGTLTIVGGTNTFSGSIVDTLGAGTSQTSLAVTTGGELILTGSNTFTGPTTIGTGSTLQVGTGGSAGSIGASAITDNGSLVYNLSGNPTISPSVSGPGSLGWNGTGTLGLASNVSVGSVNIGNGGAIAVVGSGALNAGGVSGASGLIFNSSATSTISGIINNGSLTVLSGTVALLGLNSYSGPTTVAPGANLQVGNATNGGSAQIGNAVSTSNESAVTDNGTITFMYNASPSAFSNNYTGTGTIILATNPSLTGTAGYSIKFDGNNSGFNGTIIVDSNNRFQLDNNYPGAGSTIIVEAGSGLFNNTSGGTFAGALELAGSGYASDNTPTGTYGSIRDGGSAETYTGPVTLIGNAEVFQNSGTNLMTFTGNIGETPGQNYVFSTATTAGGTVVISGTNTYTGGTTVLTGALELGSNAAFPADTPLTLGSTTAIGEATLGTTPFFDLRGFNATVSSISVNTGPTLGYFILNNGASGSTLAFAGVGGSTTFAGTIENGVSALALSVSGGTLDLTGNNTYSGGTNVTGGELIVGSANALGNTNTPPTVNGGDLNFNGNTFSFTNLAVNSGVADVAGGSITIGTLSGSGGAITNGSTTPGTLTINGNSNAAWGGSFQDGASALNVNYNSSGTLTLSGNSTSTAGTFNLNSGAIVVTGTLAAGGSVIVANSTSLSGNGSVGNVTLNGGTIEPGATPGSIASFTMSSLTANNGNLDAFISGAGIDEFVVNGAANFAGGTNLVLTPQPGTLPGIYTLVAAQTLTGSGNINFQAPTGARQQYALNFSGNDVLVDVTGQSPANLVWIGDQNNGQWDLQQTSNWFDGTYSIAHDAFYSFDNVTFNDTASDFNVNLNGNLTAGSVTVNTNGTYTFNGGSIVGSTGLTKAGTGLLVLQSQNLYTGTTALQNGTIQLQNGQGLGTGSLTFGDTNGHSGILDLDGQNVSVGGLSVVGGTANEIGSSSGGSTLNYNGGAAVSTFTGSLDDVLPGSSGNGQLQLNVNSGTLVLAGSNNFSGNINIGNNGTAGILQIGTGTTGNIGSGSININAGSLIFDVSSSPTINAQINGQQGTLGQIGVGSTLLLTQGGNWGATIIGAGSTLQVGNGDNANMGSGPIANNGLLVLDTNQNFSITGAITGSGSLQQIGSGGIVTLAGANTYTGTTTIGSGAVVVITSGMSLGSQAGGGVTIQSGAELDLSGITTALASPGLGAKAFTISGFGPNGAPYNNSTPGTAAIVNNATVSTSASAVLHGFLSVSLAGNASIGGSNFEWPNTPSSGFGRIDIGRDAASTLNLNGFSLVKTGTNFLNLATDLTVTGGNIVVNNGVLSLDTGAKLQSAAMGYVVMDGTTADSNGSTPPNLQFFNNTAGAVTAPIVFTGNNVTFGQADGAVTSTIGSNVFIGGSTTFSSYNGSNAGGLNFSGNLTDLTPAMAATLNAIPNMQNGIVGGTLGFVAGTGSIILSQSGTLTSTLILSGTSNYSGGTQINQGMTLKAGSNTGLSPVGPMTLNNGTLDVGGFSPTVGPLNGNGTITNSGSVTGTLNVDQAGNSSYNGIIIDGTSKTALGLEGSGTLQLQNANTYSGGTFLNGAVLQINNLSSLGTGGITFNGGTLQLQNNLDPSSQGITFNSGGGTLDMNGQGNVTLAHVMTGTGALTIEDSTNNNNTLTLSASNTYSGGTTVASAAVQAGAVNVFGTGPLTVGSATLANLNGYNQLVGGLAGTGGIDNIPNGNTGNPVLTINNATGHAVTFNGSLQNSNGVVSLVMSGGTQVFASANSYSGGTTITGGLLIAANGSGSATGGGNVTVDAGGGLGGGAGHVSGNVSVASGGILSLVGGSPLTLSGSLALANGSDLNFSAAATTAAGLASTLSNGIAITGSSTVNVAVPTSFTGTETFDVLSYLGSDPYADLSLGTVPAGYNGHLVNNTSGDQVDLSLTAVPVGPANLTWNNTGGTGNGTTWDTSNQNWNNGSAASLYTDGSNVTFNDTNNNHYAVTLNSSVLPLSVTFSNNTGNYTLSGTGGIAGTTALALSGTGTVTMSTTNSYSGGTNVNSGKLVVASAGALPANHALSIGATGAVALSTTGGGFSLSSLSMTTGSSLDLGSNSVTIHYGGTDPVSQIASYLATGFSSGGVHGWGGTTGVVSSAVASLNASQSALIYSVGYADGADGITSLTSGEIEILPTLAGDAKMQGNVVFGDFQLLSQYFGDSGTSWDEGDFTYNGTTNFGDFQLLSQNFGATSANLTSGELASINSFAAQYSETMEPNGSGVGYSLVSVPEPASMGILAAAGLGLLARRRRRQANGK